ncbi:MAG: glycosyltransferase family 4 protein [Candidatus Doudnabacteria bacterium]|nr:glycosyltransferase family 4 protein [Candidatus Doudnabacteria bacterium]
MYKIIQLSTYFHPSVGGVERQVEEIAYFLSQAGHDVTVLTTDATHGKEKRMQRLSDSYRGLNIIRFKYLLRIGNFFRFAPGIISFLWKADFQILHVHNIHDGHLMPAILICMLRKKKVVVTGHNPFVVDAEKRGAELHFLVRMYELFLRLFIWRLDGYVALLESEKQEVVKRFKLPEQKVFVVPNGIQDEYYAGLGNAEKFYTEWEIDRSKWQLVVGTASRLNYVKGLQNLLVAVRQLPQVLFIFAGGDDGYYPQLKKIYSQFPNVIFTESYLGTEDLKDFYAAIDIFLLPSIYEPFGMTVVEAMAQGKPVIATNKGGTTEILSTECGVLLNPQDQAAWRDQIAVFMRSPEKITDIAPKCVQAAQAYRWGNVIPQLVQVYEKI